MQVTNTTGSLASVFQDVSVGDHKREGTILAINDVVTYRFFSNLNSIATIDNLFISQVVHPAQEKNISRSSLPQVSEDCCSGQNLC